MLRTKITLVVVAAAGLAMLFAAFTSYRGIGLLVGDELERGLEDRAGAVVALLDAGRTPPARPGWTEQVLLADGSVLPGGPPAGAAPAGPGPAVRLPVSEGAARVARTGSGSSREDVVVDGTEYGVLTLPLPAGGAVTVAQSYRGAAALDRGFMWRITWTTAAATAVAALLSWWVLGRILRPVNRLVGAAHRISTTQDLAADLPPAGRDEIGRLTRSFEAMLDALRRSRAQQRQLVEDAGHELRTPLTSVRGSAELLQRARGRLSPEDEEQILATLVRETVALDDLVREVVELATDRHTGERPEAVDLAEAAGDAAHRCRRRSGREVTVEAAPGGTVYARPRAVQRCLDNLLSNAVKFSPPGSPVLVRVEGPRVSVHDRGPGIPPGQDRAVFDRFHRGPGTQGTPGSGLGLAIVHELVAADGGSVFARTAEGGGAVVGLCLPVRPPGA